MDQFSFTEICLHQLKMSGVHEGEKLIVLTQGNERLDYADAFMVNIPLTRTYISDYFRHLVVFSSVSSRSDDDH